MRLHGARFVELSRSPCDASHLLFMFGMYLPNQRFDVRTAGSEGGEATLRSLIEL